MQKIVPFDKIQDDKKEKMMDCAARWLSVRPELIGEVKTDNELIDRLIAFSKVLYEYFPEYELDPKLRDSIKGMFNG